MPNKEYRIKSDYDYEISIEYYKPAGDIEICKFYNDPDEENEIFNIDSVEELFQIIKADPRLYKEICNKITNDFSILNPK